MKLRDSTRNWIDYDSSLEELTRNYYDNLFQSQGSDMHAILDFIEACISQEENEDLILKFTSEEVKDAVFSVHPDKSPGPYGMNTSFYQRFWDIIRPDVVKECSQILLNMNNTS